MHPVARCNAPRGGSSVIQVTDSARSRPGTPRKRKRVARSGWGGMNVGRDCGVKAGLTTSAPGPAGRAGRGVSSGGALRKSASSQRAGWSALEGVQEVMGGRAGRCETRWRDPASLSGAGCLRSARLTPGASRLRGPDQATASRRRSRDAASGPLSARASRVVALLVLVAAIGPA